MNSADKLKVYSIMVVDDHPIMRDGLTQLINQQSDLNVCIEANSSSEALSKIKDNLPDLAIVDITLKDTSGLDLISDLRQICKNLKILVLSMHSEKLYAERVLRLGARGYIMKHEPADKLLKAIRRVLAGKIWLSSSMSEDILSHMAGVSSDEPEYLLKNLSDREMEVFVLIGKGLKPQQIADQLYLSVKTIETYYSRLKVKLNFKSATELRQAAIEWLKNRQ